jgi:hypothetical protein
MFRLSEAVGHPTLSEMLLSSRKPGKCINFIRNIASLAKFQHAGVAKARLSACRPKLA